MPMTRSATIARLLLAVSMAIAVIGLPACAGKSQSESEPVGEQPPATATVSSNGVSVQIPASWSVEYKDGQSFPVVTPDAFEGLLQVGVTVTYREGFSSTEDVFNDWLSVFTYADRSTEEDLSTDTTPMKRYACVVDESGTEGFAQVAIVGNEAVATIFVARDFEAHRADVESVMDSMEVTDSNGLALTEGLAPEAAGSSLARQEGSSGSDQSQGGSVQSAGSYRIGKDLPAGEYKLTCAGSHGYFCVYPDTTKADILANANFTTCTYVSVSDGQLFEVRGATFVPSSDALPTSTATGDGTYKVGFDIPAGEYEVIQDGGSMGYYAILDSCDALDSNIIDNDNFEGNSFISVNEGQFLELSRSTANPA